MEVVILSEKYLIEFVYQKNIKVKYFPKKKRKKKKKSKKLTKHVLCECKSKCDGIKRNSNQILNNRKCWCECKNHRKKTRKLHFYL